MICSKSSHLQGLHIAKRYVQVSICCMVVGHSEQDGVGNLLVQNRCFRCYPLSWVYLNLRVCVIYELVICICCPERVWWSRTIYVSHLETSWCLWASIRFSIIYYKGWFCTFPCNMSARSFPCMLICDHVFANTIVAVVVWVRLVMFWQIIYLGGGDAPWGFGHHWQLVVKRLGYT